MSGEKACTGDMHGFRRLRLPATTTLENATAVPNAPRWQRITTQSRTIQSTGSGELSGLLDSNKHKFKRGTAPKISEQAAVGRCREESTPLGNEAPATNWHSAFLVASRSGGDDASEAQLLEIEIDLGDMEDNLAGTPTAALAGLREAPAAGPSTHDGQKRLWSLPFVDPWRAPGSERQASEEEGNLSQSVTAEAPRWPSAAAEIQAESREETRWSAGDQFTAEPGWPGQRAAPLSGEQNARVSETNHPNGAVHEVLETENPHRPNGRHYLPKQLFGHENEAGKQPRPAAVAHGDPLDQGQSPAVLAGPPLSDGMHTSGSTRRGKALARRPKQPLKRVYVEHEGPPVEDAETTRGEESFSAQKRPCGLEGRGAPVGAASCEKTSQLRRLPSILTGTRRCTNSEEQSAGEAMDLDAADAAPHEEEDARGSRNPFQIRQSREKNEQTSQCRGIFVRGGLVQFHQEVTRRRMQAQLEQVPANAIRSVLQAFPQRPRPGDDAPIDLTSEDEAPGARGCEAGAPNVCLGPEDELDWDDQPLHGSEWRTTAAQTAGLRPEKRAAAGMAPPWWHALPDFVPLAALTDGINPRTGAEVHVNYKQQFVEAREKPAAEIGGRKRAAQEWVGAKKPGGRRRAATGAKRKATKWGRSKFARR